MYESEVKMKWLGRVCSLPGSSIHGIFQARVLEWGAIAFSVRGVWLGLNGIMGEKCFVLPGDKTLLLQVVGPRDLKGGAWDFPGGPVVKNPPFDAGDVGWIPGQGIKIPYTFPPK